MDAAFSGLFQHQLRNGLRKINFTASDKRQDLRGVAHAEVDRHTIQMILNRLPAYKKGTFSAILAGGLRSAKQFAKIGFSGFFDVSILLFS